jgi:abortive infection bacteriophage resistance protein
LSNGKTDLACLIGGYLWNKQLAGVILPILQCLEVTIRNAIHREATILFSTSDWYDPLTKRVGDEQFPTWCKQHPNKQNKYYRNGVSTGSRKGLTIWTSHHESMIKEAKFKLINANKPATSDAVISELMFGFWCGLFNSNYSDLTSKNKLWPHLEEKVFPNLKPVDRRYQSVFQKLDAIKHLRNRVAHHEPIWKHFTVTNSASAVLYIKTQVNDAINLIGGISSERRNLLESTEVMQRFHRLCDTEVLNKYISGKMTVMQQQVKPIKAGSLLIEKHFYRYKKR